jgi:Flp pilus assembly protein TadD
MNSRSGAATAAPLAKAPQMVARPAAPVTPSDALEDAARARAAGAWEHVLQHAERAAAGGADHAVVTELRALALTHLRRLDDAEAQFAALLGSTAHRGRAQAGLGIIALERGDDLTARAWLDRATVAGGDADAWAALGLCLTRLGETEEAWRAYVEARTLDPAHRVALHGLVTLASPLERLAELETHLRDYLARVGEDADVRFALAGCLYAAGRCDESRTVVREVLRQAPAHVLAQALEHELAS